MKHCLVTLAALLVAASSFAQGTVNFNNKAGTAVDARVFYADTAGPTPAGADFVAQLYASAPNGTLAAVGVAVPFRASGAGMGYINPASQDLTRTIPGVAENATAQAKMVAWKSVINGVTVSTYEQAVALKQGGFGESAVIPGLLTGGGLNPPTNLLGLQGFTISQVVPEPSIAALGLLGAGLLVIRRKK